MGKRIVIALGGNALGKNLPEQMEAVQHTARAIVDLIEQGNEVIVVHGNGPQVGMIANAMTELTRSDPQKYIPCPLSVCGAMSQGYIGYHIQQSLRYALARRNLNTPVVSLVTQVAVEANDPAFRNPTKPIGAFYTKEEAEELTASKGYDMKEDAGRGYRRVVASPLPRRIVEIDEVKRLWSDTIVVTCGGGGIPVVENADGTLTGVAAVIDKDYAAELLAEQVDADMLMILTEVEKVAINWGKPNQEDLSHLSLTEAARYVEEGHFAPGSMLPKVQACMKFVRSNPEKKAIITSLDKAMEALRGETGTVMTFA